MLHRTTPPDFSRRLSTRSGRPLGMVVVALLLGVFIVAVGGVAQPLMPSAYPAAGDRCPERRRPFVPKSIVIPGVDKHTTVLALRRDRRGVPRTPPLSDRGKWQFAWDKTANIRPGMERGNVKLNAHTYPDGSALGNRLLRQLREGQLIVVHGADGQKLCYKVSNRFQVSGDRGYPPYYSTTGIPRLAILVCSGVRRGPGDWSHRTIWYAKPFFSGNN
jgi:hypothetical protein